MGMSQHTVNLSELTDFARALARDLRQGIAVLLYGPLGAGKTTLAHALINDLSEQSTEVQSPTFPLCLTYDTPYGTLWHYDLYRLPDNTPLDDLGWFDARMNGIVIVEWPERIRADDLKPPFITVRLEATETDDARLITVERTDR